MHGTNPKKRQSGPPEKGLTLRTIQTLVQAAKPGMWSHERGLCLAIAKSGSAFWALRYSTKSGRRRLMTLEQYEPIDAAKLKALEWQVAEHRKQIKAGRDPLTERNAAANKTPATTISRATADTFEDVARDYIAQHKYGWKNPKHRQQWENTLATYVYRIIGKSLPHEITTNDVLGILQQKHIRKGKTGTLWTNARRTQISLPLVGAYTNSSPIQRSFLNWCGQHFDVQQATSIKRAVRMPTIAERSAMHTRLNSQNFALNGQSGVTNFPMTDASSAISIGMIHDFIPLTKTIDH